MAYHGKYHTNISKLGMSQNHIPLNQMLILKYIFGVKKNISKSQNNTQWSFSFSNMFFIEHQH